MWNDVIGKIFERGAFAQMNHGFEDRRFFRGSINSRRRRRGQANVRVGFLHNVRGEMIAAQHASCRVQEHQVGGAVRQGKRGQRLQRQGEARLGENCARAVSRKSQAKESVAPDAFRIPFTIFFSTQRAGSGGSIR